MIDIKRMAHHLFHMPVPDPTYASKVRRAREMDPEQKLLEGPRLFASACERMKDGIRHQFPEAEQTRVHEILLERLTLLKRVNEVK